MNGQNGNEIKLSTIRELFGDEFSESGFTLVKAEGFWKGDSEESVLIEHLGDLNPERAKEIKWRAERELHQESVLVTREEMKRF